MSGDFIEALYLAAAGLIYVFFFLGFLILLLILSSWIFSIFNKSKSEEYEMELAAVSTAISYHRKKLKNYNKQ